MMVQPRYLHSRQVLISLGCATVLLAATLYYSGAVNADDYTMSGETVNTGYSMNPTNRNAEDSAYNSLLEEDTYSDTNFSGSSESVDLGTAGGGSFPTALDTDDSTRRSYTEENTAGTPPSNYIHTIYPDGIAEEIEEWTIVGASSVEAVDDIGGTSDYIYPTASGQGTSFTYQDLPGSSYTRSYDVALCWYDAKSATQPCTIWLSLVVIGEVYSWTSGYLNPSTTTTNRTSGFMTVNPETSAEWTTAEINGLATGVSTNDASPTPYLYSLFLRIRVNYTATTNYELDTTITYSSVTSSSQTTGYTAYCQGYRSGSENFGVYAYDYVVEVYNLKTTINQASDYDFNFALTTDERAGSSNEVKIRILGLTETSDTVQDVVYLDVLKIRRIEVGYGLDIEIGTTSAPAYGNITLRLKGYTSAETFNLNVYNFTSEDWDIDKMVITSLSNTWQATLDLCDDHHRDGQTITVQFTDDTPAASDTTQDSLYIDVLWITRYYTDPVISLYGAVPTEVYETETIYWWCTYSDYDNQAPTYVRVVIESTPYDMTANDSSTDYFNGKLYHLEKSDLAEGEYEYYIAVKDAESPEITTTPDTVTVLASVNQAPSFTSSPDDNIHNNTYYSYDANAEDPEEDPLTFDLEGNITLWASIVPSTGVVSGTPDAVGYYWMNVSVTDGTNTVWQNTSVTVFSDSPEITSSPVTVWQHGQTYQYSAIATDYESETLIWELEGNSTTWLDITPNGYSCLVAGLVPTVGWWYANLSVSDYTSTYWQNYTITGLNQAPYFTSAPDWTAELNESYSYLPTASDVNSDSLTFSVSGSPETTLDWLFFNETSGCVEGIPTENGTYAVNLTVFDGWSYTWQNYTITVSMTLPAGDIPQILGLVLSLILGIVLPLVGFLTDKPVFMGDGGIIWIYAALDAYSYISTGVAIMGLGIGLILLLEGAISVDKKSNSV